MILTASICYREIDLEEKKPFKKLKVFSRGLNCSVPKIFSCALGLVQIKLQPIKYLVFKIANEFILSPLYDTAVCYCIIIY